MRFLLETVLSKDFDVKAFPHPFAAMNWLSKKNSPDWIITDVQFPGMNDWELQEQICGGLYSHIPMIVISSLNKQELESKCIEFGIVNHFTKPFDPLLLLKTVHSGNAAKKPNVLYSAHAS